ncbi:hypothetical protein Nepgr_031270 [Nepenthes gracilis]|uniref:Uncharacterized protein n=1 Tax=Nepenthes gracilis TaxID=150966 RepID=A0AAD3Y4N1_NEPGR|nr:hypothetical protein Nepgr_031270 [Nepenthes gracilis]
MNRVEMLKNWVPSCDDPNALNEFSKLAARFVENVYQIATSKGLGFGKNGDLSRIDILLLKFAAVFLGLAFARGGLFALSCFESYSKWTRCRHWLWRQCCPCFYHAEAKDLLLTPGTYYS